MTQNIITLDGITIPLISLDTAIIGTGCAGFNAADWLYILGRRDIALFTEGVGMGTSRNTGSDKQTYYKLSLSGNELDSVAQMAQTLFAGGGVHGDNALSEAACSARSFIKLANLGVPFPTNEYGEYVGYKTDHDPRQRATSAGPLTSKFMTEVLEKAVREKGIPIFDRYMAVELLVRENRIHGFLCLDLDGMDTPARGLCAVQAAHVVMATGGPAGCYYNSVYPESQTGMSGMALSAGAKASNLQDWQYGLASVKFRWNVSGTYQQVLPRYISIDADGIEREFLPEYFGCPYEALKMVFLKGYQWPFDIGKLNGSSMIDLIVHHEIIDLGRRVYMDFSSDPAGLENGFNGLDEEARRYLANSHALLKTPIARLKKMNLPAIKLYKSHGIDLYTEPLEVSVCAQHHNGGIAVDRNWESSIRGLYVIGEAAGTFGSYRPGGSALNSGQVGSMRAAEHIAWQPAEGSSLLEDFSALAEQQVKTLLSLFDKVCIKKGGSNIRQNRTEMQVKMSSFAAHIRDPEKINKMQRDLETALAALFGSACADNANELAELLRNQDILQTQRAVLSAMKLAADKYGSRGSAMVLDPEGIPPGVGLAGFRYCRRKPDDENLVLETCLCGGEFVSQFIPVRPLPVSDDWFENVWNSYRVRTGQNTDG